MHWCSKIEISFKVTPYFLLSPSLNRSNLSFLCRQISLHIFHISYSIASDWQQCTGYENSIARSQSSENGDDSVITQLF